MESNSSSSETKSDFLWLKNGIRTINEQFSLKKRIKLTRFRPHPLYHLPPFSFHKTAIPGCLVLAKDQGGGKEGLVSRASLRVHAHANLGVVRQESTIDGVSFKT